MEASFSDLAEIENREEEIIENPLDVRPAAPLPLARLLRPKPLQT